MNVGDYIRTNKGIIAQIKRINSTGSITCDRSVYYGFNIVNNKKVLCDLSKIIKSSLNIIDLIEVGDYVNGYLIEAKTIFGNLGLTHWVLKTPTGYLNERNIYTIVTKEQFENCMYKIGE